MAWAVDGPSPPERSDCWKNHCHDNERRGRHLSMWAADADHGLGPDPWVKWDQKGRSGHIHVTSLFESFQFLLSEDWPCRDNNFRHGHFNRMFVIRFLGETGGMIANLWP
jgi:hypothetical protein